ncbi:hypothetical protein L1049_004109 [Liquidambar formosana]|uniref:Desiccation-related protein n=1 Tax=Liquidambar formosana TaxID=63359 RepID=A0AAP0WVE0_LIQFO
MAIQPFLFPLLSILSLALTMAMGAPNCGPIVANDKDRIEFALNLEFLEAEFFLNGALGRGLDTIAPQYALSGPPSVGARIANLDALVRRIIEEFGYQEVGHLRAIISAVGGFRRPLIDLSPVNFAKIFNEAVGSILIPPFDPYANTINYLLAAYMIPYLGLVGYVGTIPFLANNTSLQLVAGLLGVEAGQDAVIRTLLYERANQTVVPYNLSVAEFTIRLSAYRNQLAMCGIKDEGIIALPPVMGAENRTTSNILSANYDSLSYSRTSPEILRILYDTGSENRPGGFFPLGANGAIARSYLI